ncbi:MAG TPA: hypothetical protein VI603_01995 [Saprospiraceae bacterium]|nr:hypothetical protein [Saprospiraceae bacterium]
MVVYIFFLNAAMGQEAALPLNSPAQTFLERLQIYGFSSEVSHSAIKPYDRIDIFSAAYHIADTGLGLSYFDLHYLLADNDEFFLFPQYQSPEESQTKFLQTHPPQSKSPFLGVFYARPAHFYALDHEDFYMRINPILHFGLGKEFDRDGLLFVNRRGIELRGGIDQKVYFNTNIIEAQLRPASYVNRFVDTFRALPDAGLYKDFDSRIIEGEGSYDYLSSSGHVGFRVSKHIGIQLGHGKNFLGDGYRSLFLSDFAKNYFYLKFNTRVWKFHYQNLFAELSAREKLPGNVVVPKKYLAAHYLSFQLSPVLSVGLFEAVVFAREENRFELQYLNPIILYRSIEHHVGSPDNVFIGLSARWDLARRVRCYSQFILDEFKFSEFFSDRKWWGNKHGLQLGVKYLDVLGMPDLDLQVEYNRVRPFTYTHYDSLGSYSHFNQSLAHPLGANFNEILFKLDYRPISRFWLCGKLFVIDAGTDTDALFYGSNILRSNTERNAEFGVHQGQGIRVQNQIFSFSAMYMLKHNVFLEAQYFRRDYDSDDSTKDLLTQYFTFGIRWNYFASRDEF